MLKMFLILIFTISLYTATYAEDSFEDDIAGFEEEETESIDTSNTSSKEPAISSKTVSSTVDILKSIFSLGGSIGLKSAINVNADKPKDNEIDYSGLSMLQASLYLNLKINLGTGRYIYASGHEFYDALYHIKDRNLYSKEYLDLYEQELKLDELYISVNLLPFLTISSGRQTIVWGNGDMFQVVDCINPLDLRTPGMVDIRDMRQPLFLSRIALNLNKFIAEAIVTHESAFNITPVAGSSFYPYPLTINKKEYSNGGENSELALSAKVLLPGWDIGINYGYLLNNSPHLTTDLPISMIEMIMNLDPSTIDIMSNNFSFEVPLIQEYARINLIGMNASSAVGNFMLKAEAAYIDGLKYLSRGNDKLSRFDFLLGTDYTGFKDMIISIEFNDRITPDHTDIMEKLEQIKKHDLGWSLRINKNLLHNNLKLMGLLTVLDMDGSNGGFTRLQGSYDIVDNFTATLGTIIYFDGDLRMYEDISKNNRITLELKYSF